MSEEGLNLNSNKNYKKTFSIKNIDVICRWHQLNLSPIKLIGINPIGLRDPWFNSYLNNSRYPTKLETNLTK